ncbi:hypothetical protein [Megasphaera sp.]|uniref:hypothetical protein n=1 Tax=Megasphaera sp. TaxID=2023260 RepID=UPI003079E8BC
MYSSLYLAVRQDCLPFHPYRSRCWRFRYGCSRHGSFLDRRLHAACRNRFGHKRSRIHRVLTRFIPCRRILDDGLDGRRPFFLSGQAEGIPAAQRQEEGRPAASSC